MGVRRHHALEIQGHAPLVERMNNLVGDAKGGQERDELGLVVVDDSALIVPPADSTLDGGLHEELDEHGLPGSGDAENQPVLDGRSPRKKNPAKENRLLS